MDSFNLLSKKDRERYSDGALDAVLYADDTLLLRSDSGRLQRILHNVAEVGARYGMELQRSKF